jgi:hypothetical protein
MPLVRVPGQRVAGARMCILSITFILLLFATRIPVHAIPSCSSGTMASYLTLGAAGCQFGDFTFSDFTYFAGFPNSTTDTSFPTTTQVSVEPALFENSISPSKKLENLHRLTFSASPTFNNVLGITFQVTGAPISQDNLLFLGLRTLSGQPAQLFESVVPGGKKSTVPLVQFLPVSDQDLLLASL